MLLSTSPEKWCFMRGRDKSSTRDTHYISRLTQTISYWIYLLHGSLFDTIFHNNRDSLIICLMKHLTLLITIVEGMFPDSNIMIFLYCKIDYISEIDFAYSKNNLSYPKISAELVLCIYIYSQLHLLSNVRVNVISYQLNFQYCFYMLTKCLINANKI